jgi:hypothetical protein
MINLSNVEARKIVEGMILKYKQQVRRLSTSRNMRNNHKNKNIFGHKPNK